MGWIAPGSKKYVMLESYVKNTHASTHSSYSLDVLEIYELEKGLDKTRFKKDIGNRRLLWHGSRLTNFVGILSQGLRIAPPEAPSTGYMFGKVFIFFLFRVSILLIWYRSQPIIVELLEKMILVCFCFVMLLLER